MSSRIFYYCYDHNRPAGGEKHSYQHVDILNRAGYEAYAFHRQCNLRLTWFDNDTPVVDGPGFLQLYRENTDILVFPEDVGSEMLAFKGQRVIFNKNLFHGFRALGATRVLRDPYRDPGTRAVLAVSDHNAQHLRTAYPGVPVHRVYAHIRQDVFFPSPAQGKLRQIACSPKATSMVMSLYHMFRARAAAGLNRGHEWRWEWLAGKSEKEMAEALRVSPVTICLGIEEGLPRLPLEAMLSGSLVIAFRTGPLAEVLPVAQGFEYGDLNGILLWLEELVGRFPDDMERYTAMVEAGRARAGEFSENRQVESVCSAWREILSEG